MFVSCLMVIWWIYPDVTHFWLVSVTPVSHLIGWLTPWWPSLVLALSGPEDVKLLQISWEPHEPGIRSIDMERHKNRTGAMVRWSTSSWVISSSSSSSSVTLHRTGASLVRWSTSTSSAPSDVWWPEQVCRAENVLCGRFCGKFYEESTTEWHRPSPHWQAIKIIY